MSINPNLETFKALHEFSTFKGGPRDKLLKVAKDKNGREYLKFVPKKEFTLQERIASVSGKSAFNLANVLKVAENAAWDMPNEVIDNKKPQEILAAAADQLKARVTTHYKKKPAQEAAVTKITQIGLLVCTKAEINTAKEAFIAELKDEEKTTFLRGSLKPAHKKLHEMLETALTESGMRKIMAQQAKNKADAPAMLQAIVENLERNPNPRIQEISGAIMSAVATRSFGKDASVKDPAAFTTAAFLLRQMPRIIDTIPKSHQGIPYINLKKWQDQVNAYSSQKTVEEPFKSLFDRLKVALVGDDTNLLKAALSDSNGRTEKIIEIFTTDSPLKAPLERICQKNHYSENFNFLNDFLAWKNNPSKEGAQDLISKYIKSGADSEINIGPNIRKILQELMKNYEANTDAVQQQLQKAMDEVIGFLAPNILGAASGGK